MAATGYIFPLVEKSGVCAKRFHTAVSIGGGGTCLMLDCTENIHRFQGFIKRPKAVRAENGSAGMLLLCASFQLCHSTFAAP